MGRRNDKRTGKTVAFFKVHYGFREPFKARPAPLMLLAAARWSSVV
jgi:hypothetical protein